jgi:diacylglycerol kinase family enzyme
LYIYDDFIQDKRFEKDVLQIENRLTDLGIAGKIARLALFRDAEEMIRDELRRGATTVIAVGNDHTVRKVLDVVAEHNVTFGLIPVGEPDVLARVLGLPQGVAGCDVLSARNVETIDIGMVNGRRFITGVSVPNFKAQLTCEGTFRITPKKAGNLEVCNIALGDGSTAAANPRDGKLEAVLKVAVPSGWLGWFGRKRIGTSVVPTQFVAIRSDKPIMVYADGEQMEGTRFDISIEPLTLKVITGRGRLF